MQIQFLNHASIKIVTDQSQITSDPWYAGAAFNNGWDLLHADPQLADIAVESTHIWLSHEHPDHFSIDFFKAAPKDKFRVLFQKTQDKRVRSFLESQGFKVDEIAEAEKFEVAPNETMRISRNGFYDSWNYFSAKGLNIVNLNDCELTSDDELQSLKDEIGTVDVLLTQFSYAAWKGGRENRALRQNAARDKLKTVLRQIEILRPVAVIPFASFVYFSHDENFYLNDAVNNIDAVLEALAGTTCQPVIMKPGDIWNVGQPWDNSSAADFWRQRYNTMADLPRHHLGSSLDMPALQSLFEKYRARVFSKNAKWLMRVAAAVPKLGAFEPLTIHLTDLNRVVRFSMFEGLSETNIQNPDVAMSSESLAFIFRNDFGYDTLTVNGRFEASDAGFGRMTKNFAVGSLNAMGLAIAPSLILRADIVFLLMRKLTAFVTRMNSTRAAAS